MRRVLAALFFAFGSVAAWAEDSPPLVQDFDPAVTEAVGTHMFRQDQFAWKATDILLAKHPQQEVIDAKLHGWIVIEGDAKNVVRFVRDGINGPEAYYDVTFGPYGDTALTEPADRTLPPDQLAQYKARKLASEKFDFRCTDTPANTIAFKDDKTGNWRVWVMTATTDPNLTILGGHIRYTVSADGGTILSTEKLSKGCGLFPKGDDKGHKAVMQYFRDVVSLKPLESHVFANYAYRIPLFIGTTDGVIWKIDQGMIKTVDLDAPEGDGFTARAIAGQNEECKLILKHDENGTPKYTIGDETKVVDATEGDKKFAPKAPSGNEVSAVTCQREDIVPAPNDYKVLLAGYVLYISDIGRGHPKRMITLEVRGGQLDIEFKDGALTPDVTARMQKRIDALQTAFDAATKK